MKKMLSMIFAAAAVSAAGAVVTKDVTPNTVVGGVPTKIIKTITED